MVMSWIVMNSACITCTVNDTIHFSLACSVKEELVSVRETSDEFLHESRQMRQDLLEQKVTLCCTTHGITLSCREVTTMKSDSVGYCMNILSH